MPTGPGNDLGRTMTVDERLGNDKAGAKRAHDGLGWNAHAIINPFSFVFESATIRWSVSQGIPRVCSVECRSSRRRTKESNCIHFTEVNTRYQYTR